MNLIYRWWKESDPGAAVYQVVDGLLQRQGDRKQKIIHWIRLYTDRHIVGYAPSTYTQASPYSDTVRSRLSLNVVRNTTETAVSSLSKRMPKISFVPNSGDWSLDRKAKNRERLVAAVFAKEDVEHKRVKALQQMALLGSGAIKVFNKPDGDIGIEPVFIGELVVDEVEAVNGDPRSLYQQRTYDKGILAEMFPEHREDIENATVPDDYDYSQSASAADQVVVTEAWHLPSSEGADDGKRVIAIPGATLLNEPYTKNYFPFAFWTWSPDVLGFWGSGLAEQLDGIQFEINQILMLFQTGTYMGGNMKIFVEKGSKVTDQHIGNDPLGQIVEYSGQPPIWAINPVISPEIVQHLWNLDAKAYEITGISRMSATGEVPSNLQSGRAQLVAKRTSSERFSTVMKNDERAVKHLATLILDVIEEKLDAGEKYKINCKEKNWMGTIDAKDAVIDRNCAQMSVIPSSSLPDTLAGKLEMTQQMFDQGVISKQQQVQLLDMPDVAAEVDLSNAGYSMVDKLIEEILEGGDFTAPDPRLPLAYAQQRAQQAFNYVRQRSDVPEDLIKNLSDWINAVQALVEKQAAEAAATAAQQQMEAQQVAQQQMLAQQSAQAGPPAAGPPIPAGAPPMAPAAQ